MSDSVSTNCPRCDLAIKVSARFAGKKVKCPECEAGVSIPSVRSAPADREANESRRREGRPKASGQKAAERRQRDPESSDFDLAVALESIDDYEDLPDPDDEERDDRRRSRKPARRSKVDKSVKGVWRDGRIVVLAHGARLPKRCFKSNGSDVTRKSIELGYTPPASTLIQMPLAMLSLVFLGGAVTVHRYRKVEIDICYSKRWKKRLLLRRLAGLGTCALGMAMIYSFLVQSAFLPALIGFFCMVGGLIVAGSGDHISAQKIDDKYVRLRGAGKRFLETLPDWRKSR
jgi:hypothetical protein